MAGRRHQLSGWSDDMEAPDWSRGGRGVDGRAANRAAAQRNGPRRDCFASTAKLYEDLLAAGVVEARSRNTLVQTLNPVFSRISDNLHARHSRHS